MIKRALTSRWAICTCNFLLFLISGVTIYKAALLLVDFQNNFNMIEDLLDGIGVIFVAYGVALEERETIMSFLDIYPRYSNTLENEIDHLCHSFGLWFLLLGLFMELTAEVVKLPSIFFKTLEDERLIFSAGFICCSTAGFFFLRHAWLLLRINQPEKDI